jgi:hypothetical protein
MLHLEQAQGAAVERGLVPAAPLADMAQRFIINKAAILAAAVQRGPHIYSVQTDRISRLYP